MVERYRNIVGDANAPQARMSNPVDFASTGVQVAKAVGDVGDTVEYIGKLQAHRRNERAKLDANNASNAYQKMLTQYLYDPDNGAYTQRKLGNADNVTADFSDFADKSIEEISSGLTPEAADIFRRMAGDITMPMWKQTSVYEAKEMRDFNVGSWEATIAQSINDAALDPTNEDLFQLNLDRAAISFMELNKGASQEFLKQGINKIASDMAVAGIQRVAATDPVAAQDMIENSRYLTEESRTKLYAKNKGDVMLRENQGIVDQLIAQYGTENEPAVLEYLHANFEGEEEQQVVSLYRQRVAEAEVRKNNADKAVRDAQEQYRDQILLGIYDGNVPNPVQMRNDVASGKISINDYHTINTAILNAGNYSKAEAQVRAEMPGSTYEQQQAEVCFRISGCTPAEITENVNIGKQKAMSGSLDDKTVDGWVANGFFTKADGENLKSISKKWGKEQKGYYNEQKERLGRELGETIKQAGMDQFTKEVVMDKFAAQVAELPTNLTIEQYKTEVTKIRANTLSDFMYDIEKGSEEGRYKKKAYTESMQKYKNNLQQMSALENDPTLQASPQGRAMEGYRSNVNVQVQQGAGGVAGQMNIALSGQVRGTSGIQYEMGAKDLKSGKVDCSGLVCAVYGNSMKSVNKVNGQEIFDKDARGAMTGASADIIQNVANKTGVLIESPNAGQLQEGMVIGLNANPKTAGGRGFKGVDHVAMVIRDRDTGELMIYESRSGDGVTVEPVTGWLKRYRQRGVPIYAVNPMLMAKGAGGNTSGQQKNPLAPGASANTRPSGDDFFAGAMGAR